MSALRATAPLRTPPFRRPRLLRPRLTLPVVAVVAVAWAAEVAEVAAGSATPRLGLAGLPMWIGMTMAMMLPGALPAVRHVAGHTLSWRRRQAVAEWLVVYLGVWTLAGVASLVTLEALDVDPVRTLPVLLLAAAAWQLTPAKRRALWRCHRTAPLYPRGRRATSAVARFAARNATGCVGSCWLLMAAMVLAPGAARLALMAALTALVTTEKLTDRPRRAVRWGAAGLLLAAVVVFLVLVPGAVAQDFRRHSLVVDATQLQATPPNGAVQDPSAPDGSVLELADGTSAEGAVELPKGIARIYVDLRADVCQGNPKAVLSVDGREVGTTIRATRRWATYKVPVEVPVLAGPHTFAIRMDQDAATSSCDRSLYVDNAYFNYGAMIPDPQAFFVADYETGDLSQWDDTHQTRPDLDLISVIPWTSDPAAAKQGRYGARFEVNGSDPSDPTKTDRDEVRVFPRRINAFDGNEMWYGWSTYFPGGFSSEGVSNFFAQFKRIGGLCGSPNMSFRVDSTRNTLAVGTSGGTVDDSQTTTDCPGAIKHTFVIGDLVPGRWNDIVVHVRWSDDPDVGFLELWLNGRLAIPQTDLPNFYSTEAGSAFRQGLYRLDAPGTDWDYQDGFRAGASYRQVMARP